VNFGSLFDRIDLAEAIIILSAGILLRTPLRVWFPVYALFAANLVFDRVAIQQAQSPALIMAWWHGLAIVSCLTLGQCKHILTNTLIFACMFSLDGLSVAGVISDKPVSGLGFDFWNVQSTLHHAQFLVIISLISQARAGHVGSSDRAGNR
jgi:hypothetical protein